MLTRFEQGELWFTGFHQPIQITEMGTSHLLNTVKMLIQKPDIVQSMLIVDLESGEFSDNVWRATKPEDDRKQSIFNATSLNTEQLIDYVCESTLFKAMLQQLEERGVNVKNIISLILPERDPA